MSSTTPTLRPRRAEQVPSVLCLDATPERDAAPQLPACLRAPPRSHPRKPGPLLHVSAHLPLRGRGISSSTEGHRQPPSPSGGRLGWGWSCPNFILLDALRTQRKSNLNIEKTFVSFVSFVVRELAFHWNLTSTGWPGWSLVASTGAGRASIRNTSLARSCRL
jgi:hypothetical protein